MEKTYEEGFIKGVSSYVELCAKHPDCDGCPLVAEIASHSSCEDFIRTSPQIAAGIIKRSLSDSHTYFSEYRMRFPQSKISVTDLADSVCRDIVFKGDASCVGGDCLRCWKSEYAEE